MAKKLLLRRDTASNWTTADPTLADGEIGYETDTGKIKIGDGSTIWSLLPYRLTSGEINTASNVGLSGVGLFLQKTAEDLEFKNIDAGSSKITITNDGVNDTVDIDVSEGAINHDSLLNTHNLTTDINHNTILNNHNLTTDIDHDTITNTHNLTTSIDHNSITNTHNLTTDIDHDTLTNYVVGQHRIINDAGTSTTELWSASKISSEIAAASSEESIIIACTFAGSSLLVNTGVATFRMPYAFTVSDVRASVATAPTGSTIVVDINESGTSILSTKLSIDATEKTSTTAATPAVISDTSLADDAEITIDIDQVGSTVEGTDLIVTIIGEQT